VKSIKLVSPSNMHNTNVHKGGLVLDKTYTTIQGDTWDMIAYKLTSHESFMTSLLRANPDHIRTVIFSSGTVLNVPPESAIELDGLPPWRVGGETV
jgi:phage tail protein X